jgi:hypothetical protein
LTLDCGDWSARREMRRTTISSMQSTATSESSRKEDYENVRSARNCAALRISRTCPSPPELAAFADHARA